MWETFNHRKFPRIKVKCDVTVKEQNSSDVFNTETENIGAGGICVFINKALPSFSPVTLKIELNDKNGTLPIECIGKVVWCIQNKTLHHGTSHYDVGIEFQNISTANRERIRQFIQQKVTD